MQQGSEHILQFHWAWLGCDPGCGWLGVPWGSFFAVCACDGQTIFSKTFRAKDAPCCAGLKPLDLALSKPCLFAQTTNTRQFRGAGENVSLRTFNCRTGDRHVCGPFRLLCIFSLLIRRCVGSELLFLFLLTEQPNTSGRSGSRHDALIWNTLSLLQTARHSNWFFPCVLETSPLSTNRHSRVLSQGK